MDDLISKLSEIRSNYNCFNEAEEPYYRALSEAIRILSKRADGDTISRRAAIGAIESAKTARTPDGEIYVAKLNAEMNIQILPPAQSERKRGKWIHGRELSREMIGDVVTAIFYEGWECSECHCLVQEEREPLWNFCPSCGADMRGEEE